jgi:hypothetical protein
MTANSFIGSFQAICFRIREIGIRMALGAKRERVPGLALIDGLCDRRCSVSGLGLRRLG